MDRPRGHRITTAHFSAVALLLSIAAVSVRAQASFQTVSSGSWTSPSTWQITSGSDADGIPDTNDIVTILSGHSVTLTAATQGCAALVVSASGTLQLSGAGNLQITAPGSATINGTLVLSSSGSLTKFSSGADTLYAGSTGKITISGTANPPGFDVYRLDPASTFEYTYAGDQNVRCDFVYGNLNLGGSGLKTAAPLPKDTAFHCDGTLTVSNGVSVDISTNILNIYLNGNLVNNGTIDASVGITILWMTGSTWNNNGSYLGSTDTSWDAHNLKATATFTNTTLTGSPVAQTFQFFSVKGTVSVLSNLVIKKNLTVTPGAILNAGSGLIYAIGGNLINNGTFNAGTSTVTLNGAANQWIGATTLYNLTLNNAAGASLAGDVTIASGGTLTLSNGSLTTLARTLTIAGTNPGALVTGTNTIVGTIMRSIASGSSGTYLLFGPNAYVIPGGINNPTSITATVYPGTNPPALPAQSDTSMIAKRYYVITPTGSGPGFNYTLRLTYLQSEVRGNEADYTLWAYNGSGWTNYGASSLDTAQNFAQQVGITGTYVWCLGENNVPLPIQLAGFAGALVAGTSNVELTWVTLSETENFGFTLERSLSTADAFLEVPSSFVAGHGTTIQRHTYSWTDRHLMPGTYYYRLRQVDLDGGVHYSEPVKVEVASHVDKQGPEGFALQQNYPNPFNPSTEIRFTVDTSGPTNLAVYNGIGQIVATLFNGIASAGQEYVVRLDGSQLASGVYYSKLTSGSRTDLRKMVLLR